MKVSEKQAFSLQYHSLRSVVGPQDQEMGRKRYTGVTRADNLFALNSDENVRAFLGRDGDGEKRKSTLVNVAIRETIENRREDFAMLNSGVVIICLNATVDDNAKTAKLVSPSIINGAQTKGVLEEYFKEHLEDTDYPWVNFELIVCEEDLVGDISIARNYQNKVSDISIYGRLGRFETLAKVMKKEFPEKPLRTSETDFGDDFLDTEKLVQVLTTMAPREVDFPSAARSRNTPETLYRVYAYRHRSRCLKDFATVVDEQRGWEGAYSYYLDVATDAWKLYWRLKGEQAFSSLKSVKAEDPGASRKVVAPDGVPDGIVFPMLSAMSRFVVQTSAGWRLMVPSNFPWQTLFSQAKQHVTTTAAHNPQTMGKSAAIYIALHGSVEMFSAGVNS